MENSIRDFCYKCHRPLSSCMCKYITQIDTNTKFIILMHPKEFRKTKNITGHFTNLSLINSQIYVGIDFSTHKEVNELIEDPNNSCYVLYPDKNSIVLNNNNINKAHKRNVIFIIDGTWPCAKKILKLSLNINKLQKISFIHNKSSVYKIKTQPKEFCLSTMESTLCVIEILNQQGIESIEGEKLDKFLIPFKKMVEYQYEKAIKHTNTKVKEKDAFKA